jgi:hypothetical protein
LSDVVKRPTPSADELTQGELTAGARLLREKLAGWKPALILFRFRESAAAMLGSAPPVGQGPALEGIPTFRMEGPYAARAKIQGNLRELSELLGLTTGGQQAPRPRETASVAGAETEIFSQPVTAVDKDAGRVRIPRAAKRLFPASRSTVTVVLRGVRMEARYDPRTGPDRERSAVLTIGRQVAAGIGELERLRVSVRESDGLVSLE